MSNGDLRVLIIADDPLVRAGLTALLADHPQCQVVAQFGREAGADLPAEVSIYRPDVIVWDLGWDFDESERSQQQLDQLSDLVEAAPPVLALIEDGSQANAVWDTGIRGLLPRDVPIDKLAAALQALVEGLMVLEPAFTPIRTLPRGEGAQPPVEALTARELEVLTLVAEGLSNRAIASQLDISEHTVKFHLNAVLSKLGAQSRTEAVVRAMRLGLILL
jgi:two-component system nitrate/nitrite response regulator NarL